MVTNLRSEEKKLSYSSGRKRFAVVKAVADSLYDLPVPVNLSYL